MSNSNNSKETTEKLFYKILGENEPFFLQLCRTLREVNFTNSVNTLKKHH